jgi:hypothetical protein
MDLPRKGQTMKLRAESQEVTWADSHGPSSGVCGISYFSRHGTNESEKPTVLDKVVGSTGQS